MSGSESSCWGTPLCWTPGVGIDPTDTMYMLIRGRCTLCVSTRLSARAKFQRRLGGLLVLAGAWYASGRLLGILKLAVPSPQVLNVVHVSEWARTFRY